MAKKRRKRSYGSGSIIPPNIPGGAWKVRVRHNGKRITKGGIPSRELAERILAKLQADGTAHEFGLLGARVEAGTLSEYAVGFLQRRKAHHAAHDQDVSRWKRHLEPYFGHLKPSEVDRPLVRKFIEMKLTGGLASGTVRIMVSLLACLFDDLIEDRLAESNPAKALPKKVQRLIQPSHDPRTTPFLERTGDIERIFRSLPTPLHIAFALGVLAGLRTSEAAGLRWRHVDLKGRRIHVREQASDKKGEETKKLKDKESRMVPILDGLIPILTAWKMETGGDGDDLVVPPMRIDGRKISKQTRGKYLRAVLRDLGLERDGLGWYECTRHTFASQWVIHGGSIEKLKEILGHYSVIVTERYAHLRVDLFSEKDLGIIPVMLSPQQAARVSKLHN